MKNNITELVFILDRSGSMSGLEADTIGGFNSMIEKQKCEKGGCYVSTVLFDNEIQVLHDRVKLHDIPLMTDKDYTVGGCTAKEAFFMTILEDLYYGNVRPWERPVKKESKEQNAVQLMVNNEEKLRATLTEQQKEMLDKYRDSYNELMSICEREAFTVGFTLATRIMVEVMQGLTEVEDI